MSAKKPNDFWRVLATAWMCFTRVPAPKPLMRHADGQQQSLEEAVRLFPLFGIAIGACAALVFMGANYLFEDKALAVLLSMISTILITGALHEDGLGDFFDGFGGGWWSRERILEIMKDSRTGTFGVLALVLAVLVKFAALMALPVALIPAALIAAHAFSRFASGSFFFTDHYARANDKSHFKPMAKGQMGRRDFVILTLFGLAPMALLGDWRYVLLVPVLWLVRQLFGRWFIRKLDGYTGDCLGATQQVVELAFYLGVIAFGKFLA